MQQDRDRREHYQMRAGGWRGDGNNTRFNERDQYLQNSDPFLEEIWEFIGERMDRRERMRRRY